MPVAFKTSPTMMLVAGALLAGGLACHQPAPAAPEPRPAPRPAPTHAAAPVAPRVEAPPIAGAEVSSADLAPKAGTQKEAEYRRAANAALQDVHFAYDKSGVSAADKPILVAIAGFMKAYPQARLLIDGNCDDRGTLEYNLALGGRRAQAAMDYLVSLGVSAARLSTTSYGKEKPLCTQATESCWSRNRRAHFSLK